jgi:hypothetical protein
MTLEQQIDIPESSLGTIKSHLFQNWNNSFFWIVTSAFNGDISLSTRNNIAGNIISGIRIPRRITNLHNHFVRDRPNISIFSGN